jgi:subtilisin family serine protease
LRPSLDRSVPATFAPLARAELGLDGTGAAVGIVDTGCDFRHADLQRADGTTRIAALLDVATPDDARHADLGSYGGAIWLASEIDAQLAADRAMQTPAVPVAEQDVDGHGTHVAGIAASSGLATGNGLPAGRYLGMAPAAPILCARAARDGHTFSEDDVASSVKFVFDRAAGLGLPAAVNLSLSGDGGPHDGTGAFEQTLDQLVGADAPGRALVVAAGNGGARDLHAGGWSLAGTVEAQIQLDRGALASTDIVVDLWFSGPPPAITVVAPDGYTAGPVAAGASSDSGADASEGRAVIDDASMGVDPLNGRYEAYVQVEGNHGKPLQSGVWTLRLDGSATRWDGWLVGVPPDSLAPRFLTHLDPDDRAQLPAATPHAIAVGSYVTKSGWTNAAGGTITRTVVDGRPSSFSGTGPTADGRFLPDLSAPGEFIASALSRDAEPDNPASVFYVPGMTSYLWADDGVHGLLRGTSQAAPHVTGACALLLELDPTLTVDELREILRASALPRAGEPGFSQREGFGQLDAGRAARLLGRLRGRSGVPSVGPADAAASSVGVSRDALPPGAGRVTVTVVPRDVDAAPLGPGRAVAITASSDGAPREALFDGPVVDLGAGRYERSFRADGREGEALVVSATVDGVALAARPTVWLVSDRDRIGQPFAASGACQLAPRPSAAPLALAAALAAAAVALAARRARATRSGGRAPKG